MTDTLGGDWLYTRYDKPPETGEVIIAEEFDGSGIYYCRFGLVNGTGEPAWFQLD